MLDNFPPAWAGNEKKRGKKMQELFRSQSIDAAELTSRCCNQKPLRLQYKAAYEDRTHYICVDCGADYFLKPDQGQKPKLSDA
jgi:hypothetical protein